MYCFYGFFLLTLASWHNLVLIVPYPNTLEQVFETNSQYGKNLYFCLSGTSL